MASKKSKLSEEKNQPRAQTTIPLLSYRKSKQKRSISPSAVTIQLMNILLLPTNFFCEP